MAYTKQTWQTGEVITADKLNHIEDGIENNNPGYEIVDSEQIILDENVTVTNNGAKFEYSELINYPTITVDFNGDIYECELIKDPNDPFNAYGGLGDSDPDFTEYPFVILSAERGNVLFVENPGDYSVKIYVQESTINTTEDFEKSVTKVINENVSSNIKNLKDDPSNSGGTIEGMIVGATTTVNGQNLTIDDETSNKATGAFAHAEGGSVYYFSDEDMYIYGSTTASGIASHAEGYKTTASGDYSHAEVYRTTASGVFSHAEGSSTTASGEESHAEGGGTTASGQSSHAEGYVTTASGQSSHAEGSYTIASSENQHVQGKFNVEDVNNVYAFIIGNGNGAQGGRHNAFAMKWDGTFVFANGTEITPAQFASLLALLN